MDTFRVTLHSNTLLGKYVLAHAGSAYRDVFRDIEFLHDVDLPMYLPKERRKHVLLPVPAATGQTHALLDLTSGKVITMRVTRVLEGHSKGFVLDRSEGTHIVREIVLSAESPVVLREFVAAAQRTVQADMALAASEGVACHVYDPRYGNWDTLNTSPRRSMSSVFIPKEDKQRLMDHVRRFLDPATRKAHVHHGVPYKSNILLYGPPGTGKTSTIHAIASEIESDVCVVSFTRDFDDRGLARAINDIEGIARGPKILVLEDVDCLFEDRKEHDAARNAVTLSGLLNCLDGLLRAEGVLVFLTANRVRVLDAAFVRPGRVDLAIAYRATLAREELRAMYAHFVPGGSQEAFEVLQAAVPEGACPSLLQGWFFHRRASDLETPEGVRAHLPELAAWAAAASGLGPEASPGSMYA
jgi:predicted AAA+ superfamily ATPase